MKKITTLLFSCIFIWMQSNAQWAESIIDDNLNRATSFCINDIDDDGDQDIVAAIFGSQNLILYENDNGTWHVRSVDSNIGAVGVVSDDLNKDGKKDIVIAGFSANKVKWYQNMGGEPNEWDEKDIGTNIGGAEFVYVADIDNDNNNDVIATGFKDDIVVWYQNDGTSANWLVDTIVTNIIGPIMCIAKDIDGDGNIDVMVNSGIENKLVWFKNENNGQDWTEQIVDDNLPGISEFDLADVDKDGDLDIVAGAANSDFISFYENLGGDSVTWNSYLVDDNLNGAFGIQFADMNNDGDLDVIATGKDSKEVVVYENLGGTSPIDFNKTVIKSGIETAWEIRAGDVDGDTDLDIIVNQFISGGKLFCFLNPHVPNAIGNNQYANHFAIYPNPNNGIFNVSLTSFNKAFVNFYDIRGRVLLEPKKINGLETQFDLSSFAKGIYLVEFRNNNYIQTSKVIIE